MVRGGRVSRIDADPEIRRFILATLFRNLDPPTAGGIREAIEARFPDREAPSISAIRRWIRRWRAGGGSPGQKSGR